MVVKYFALTLLSRGEIRQSGIWPAERRPMLEPPRRLKIIRVVNVLLVIKMNDLLHAIFVAVGFHQHGIRREGKTGGLQEQMAGHVARRRQIFRSAGTAT